jgi:hypothetical protein
MLDRAQVCKLKAPILAAMLCKARDLTLDIAIVKAGKDNSGLENFVLQTIPPALVPGTILAAHTLPESLSATLPRDLFTPLSRLPQRLSFCFLFFLSRLVYALTFDLLRNRATTLNIYARVYFLLGLPRVSGSPPSLPYHVRLKKDGVRRRSLY